MDLFTLVRNNNVDAVDDRLNEELDLEDLTDGYGRTLMHWASSPEMIDLLVEYGFQIDAVDENDDTPLLLAIKEGDYELVQAFLNHDSNPNHYNNKGNNALMLAIEKNDIPVMELLLDNGADINSTNDHGYTALMYAAYHCNSDATNLLIKNRAGLDEVNEYLDSALHIAVFKQCAKVARLLLKAGARVSSMNEYGYTPESLARYLHNDHLANEIRDLRLSGVKSAYRK